MPSDEASRQKAIKYYQHLCLFQTILAVGLLVCGGVAYHYRTDSTPSLVYNISVFLTGGMLVIACLLSFRVFNNGPSYDVTETAKNDVLCGIRWHRAMCMFLIIALIYGLSVTWMYGICVNKDDACAYEENVQANETMAIVIFVLSVLALLTAGAGIYVVRIYGPVFGITIVPGRRGEMAAVPSAISGRRNNRQGGGAGENNDSVVQQLQQQNQILQQQLQEQQQQQNQSPFYPYTPPASNFSHCYTNMAFTLPELPPYSPAPQDQTAPPASSSYPPGMSSVLPCDPPPPYSEVSESKEQ